MLLVPVVLQWLIPQTVRGYQRRCVAMKDGMVALAPAQTFNHEGRNAVPGGEAHRERERRPIPSYLAVRDHYRTASAPLHALTSGSADVSQSMVASRPAW